jgi:hypothetical protein
VSTASRAVCLTKALGSIRSRLRKSCADSKACMAYVGSERAMARRITRWGSADRSITI